MKGIISRVWVYAVCFIAVELLSLLAFFIPALGGVIFVLILALVAWLGFGRFEYALLLALAELFTNSKGYLFSLELFGTRLSLRMGTFIVLWLVWFLIKIKTKHHNLAQSRHTLMWYGLLGVLILISVAEALAAHYPFRTIFLDVNAYFFLAYVVLFLDMFQIRASVYEAIQLMFGSIIATFIKTFGILLLFTYGSNGVAHMVYLWVRNTGSGEITPVSGSFYRVFLQSQVWSLLGLCIVFVCIGLLYANASVKHKKTCIAILFASSFTLLLSFSRSFWLGGVAALIVALALFVFKERMRTRKIVLLFLTIAALVGVEFGLIHLFVSSDVGGYLGRRVSDISEEAASSRLNQLLPLTEAIARHPILGSGFGATVTYITNDPRARALSPEGRLTTFAFEWGYLDIVLKLGVLGLAVYLVLIGRVMLGLWWGLEHEKKQPIEYALNLGFIVGFVALLATHVVSPYINHPLGMAYLIIAEMLLITNRPKTMNF